MFLGQETGVVVAPQQQQPGLWAATKTAIGNLVQKFPGVASDVIVAKANAKASEAAAKVERARARSATKPEGLPPPPSYVAKGLLTPAVIGAVAVGGVVLWMVLKKSKTGK